MGFIEISIYQKNEFYFYKWKKLKFPENLKRKLFDRKNATKILSWSQMVTIHEWKNNIILFGGSNPFQNIFMYNCLTQKWNLLKTKKNGFGHSRKNKIET